MDDEIPDENPDPGWPKHDRVERNANALFVTDAELYRRLGVGAQTGRIAVRHLELREGFPKKDTLFGNRRYWPAVRKYLDDRYFSKNSGYRVQVPDGPETVPEPNARRRPVLEAAKRRLEERAAGSSLGPDAPELDRARWGYTDRAGNFRRTGAGLRSGQVRVTAPDGRKWVEDANKTDPALWHRKRSLKPRTPPETT